MKKWNGYLMAILLILLICFVAASLTNCASDFSEACIWYDERMVDGNQTYTLHSFKKVCFADAYYWDGSESGMVVNVPDECRGYKVTSLGGFAGTGVPSPFSVQVSNIDMVYHESALPEDAVINPLYFTINIGKHVDSLRLVAMRDFHRDADTQEFYRILVTVNCSEENKTFYSKDGRLYWRADDKLVDDFCYASDYIAK